MCRGLVLTTVKQGSTSEDNVRMLVVFIAENGLQRLWRDVWLQVMEHSPKPLDAFLYGTTANVHGGIAALNK